MRFGQLKRRGFISLLAGVRRIDALIPNALLFFCSTIIGIVAIELSLRALYPISFMNVEPPAQEAGGELFLPDLVLGWRPISGTYLCGESDIHLGRSILPKATSGAKVLFIGDSVTARGKIVNGLAELMPSVTFLNGGIEGYNIEQEVEFFFRFQSCLRPDAIIHQMHINDLHASRFLKRHRDGTVSLYSPRVRQVDINPTLYRYSQLYRFLVANLTARYSKDELKAAAVDSLRRMRDYTQQNGIAYHLVLFPSLEPLADWSAYDKETRNYLLTVARELGLPVIDLLPVAERLIAAGIDPKPGPRDMWHPNDRMGYEAAKYIVLTTDLTGGH